MLSKTDEVTGKTKLRLYTEIKEQTGIIPDELRDLPDLPTETTHIWHWFCDLSRARSAGGFAANPVSWSDVLAYFTLIGVKPARWEIEAIRGLDDALLLSHSEKTTSSAKTAKDLRRHLTGKAAQDPDQPQLFD